jgi:hypothetical protein
MGIVLAMALVVLFVVKVFPLLQIWLQKATWLNNKRTEGIFEHLYIEGKAFYLYRFRNFPCVTFVDDIDVSKAFAFINNNFNDRIVDIYQSCFFNREEGKQQFNKTLFVLYNKVIVELYSDHARILHPNNKYDFADKLLKSLSEFKLPEKQVDYEINIITCGSTGLELKQLAIKPTNLDIGLYYNDDFKDVDAIIRSRLNQSNDKGIVLLHGLPGTGKTTYLRHLIGGLNKRVLFVSPSVAGNLMNPEFIDLLIDNPNAVLVIEDAENIIMDRKYNNNSSVSNLLNISDGLLSDCLNVQIICTFNSALNLIDSALMRKGRLIARYEFGKLSVSKAQQLSNHLGLQQVIVKPMTLAEVANPDDKDFEVKKMNSIGFRKEIAEN